MAPRKSTKSPEILEEKPPVKPAAKPRAKKAAVPTELPKAEVLPTPEPVKAPRPGRKPKALAVPAPDAAPQEPLPAPIPPASGSPLPLSSQVQAVLVAIQEGRAVEFIFADGETNPPRTFEPRQLIFDVFTKAWFVWGWDRRYNAERHHRVDLLAEVNAVEGMGRAAQGPYKDGTPANQVGGWLGGEPIPVKAVLLKQWIYAVKQAPAPFPDFKLEDLEEGKAQVSFVGTDLRAIARWCMQFGDGSPGAGTPAPHRPDQAGGRSLGRQAHPVRADPPAQADRSQARGPARSQAGAAAGTSSPGGASPARAQGGSRASNLPRAEGIRISQAQARQDRDPHRPPVARVPARPILP